MAVLGDGAFAAVYPLSGLAGASASLLFKDLTRVGASAYVGTYLVRVFGLPGAPVLEVCGRLGGGEWGVRIRAGNMWGTLSSPAVPSSTVRKSSFDTAHERAERPCRILAWSWQHRYERVQYQEHFSCQ